MNQNLVDLVRHNVWANKALIAACRAVPAEELVAPGVAAYGSILATFDHIVASDAHYLRSLGGSAPEWSPDDESDLEELEARVDEIGPLWDDFLTKPFDAEKTLHLDDGYECPAGIVIAQAIHHGNTHREQVCAILTGLGIEPPDIQPWGYADATGRGRFTT